MIKSLLSLLLLTTIPAFANNVDLDGAYFIPGNQEGFPFLFENKKFNSAGDLISFSSISGRKFNQDQFGEFVGDRPYANSDHSKIKILNDGSLEYQYSVSPLPFSEKSIIYYVKANENRSYFCKRPNYSYIYWVGQTSNFYAEKTPAASYVIINPSGVKLRGIGNVTESTLVIEFGKSQLMVNLIEPNLSTVKQFNEGIFEVNCRRLGN